jgi:DNA-binding NarL/FixJ family response regulator
VEEHEIFRRGLSATLREDPSVVVVYEGSDGPVPVQADAVVASIAAARRHRFRAPLVVSGRGRGVEDIPDSARVMAVLPRSTLTSEQLVAAVRAAAAGLSVREDAAANGAAAPLDDRSVAILRLLADGADTDEISRSLRYSPRTIKSCIYGIERDLGARNRVQAVAVGIRQGLI